MARILQFIGGFILSFLLIVGLFTGIIWYTKEYTEPPPPGVNIDSLLAAGLRKLLQILFSLTITF